MAIKKRGLGRGLEALLVDVPVTEDNSEQQSSPSTGINSNETDILIEKLETPPFIEETNAQYANTLIDSLRKKNANLLHEAEALRTLIDELTQIIERL
jgi:hypothetical protein